MGRAPKVKAAKKVEGIAASVQPRPRLRHVIWVIVGIGIVLRTIAWLGRAEFWVDEVAIARNVLERSLWQIITVPLDYGQTAPKGFLVMEWLVARVVGSSDIAFRFVPWAAGVASLVLFKRLVERVLGDVGQIVALLIFAIGQSFIFYSAEAKQYSLDLALSLWLVAWTIDVREAGWPRAQVVRLALAGFVAVWFSQFAVIVLAALGLTLALLELRDGLRVAAHRLWPLALAWGAGAAVATVVSLKNMFPATAGYMYWFHALNMPPGGTGDVPWLWNRLRLMMTSFQGWALDNRLWTSLYPVLGLAGLIALAIRRKDKAALVVAPLVVTLALVAAHQYPLVPRLTLLLMAILVIGVGELAQRFAEVPGRAGRMIGTTLAFLLAAPVVVRLVRHPPPYQFETPGPILRAVRTEWRAGDKLFAPSATALVTDYYAPRLGWREGEDYRHAECSTGSQKLERTISVVDGFRGLPRVWVIAIVSDDLGPPLELVYARYLGVERHAVIAPLPGSSGSQPGQPYENSRAFLFDFSDSTRLAAHPRGSFRVGRRRPRSALAIRQADPRWCYGVFMPHMAESRGQVPPAWR